MHPYRLIFHSHIEEDHNNILCFLKHVKLTFKRRRKSNFIFLPSQLPLYFNIKKDTACCLGCPLWCPPLTPSKLCGYTSFKNTRETTKKCSYIPFENFKTEWTLLDEVPGQGLPDVHLAVYDEGVVKIFCTPYIFIHRWRENQ